MQYANDIWRTIQNPQKNKQQKLCSLNKQNNLNNKEPHVGRQIYHADFLCEEKVTLLGTTQEKNHR